MEQVLHVIFIQYSIYLILHFFKILYERWRIMAVKRLKFKKENCIGCQLCMQACSGMHEGEYSVSKARLQIESYYNQGKELTISKHLCTLCGICEKECPFEAISIDEKVLVDMDACTGCGICVEKCPTKVIQLREEKAIICDTCNGDPWCVKMCPHGALKFE